MRAGHPQDRIYLLGYRLGMESAIEDGAADHEGPGARVPHGLHAFRPVNADGGIAAAGT